MAGVGKLEVAGQQGLRASSSGSDWAGLCKELTEQPTVRLYRLFFLQFLATSCPESLLWKIKYIFS